MRRTLRGRKGSWRRMQRLGRMFELTGRQRGNLNEDLVEEILAEFKSQNKILGFEQNWNLDRVGIDFLIYLPNRELVAIQVKSSPKGAEKHYKRYGNSMKYKNKGIACLVLVVNTRYLVDRNQLKIDIKNFIDNIDRT